MIVLPVCPLVSLDGLVPAGSESPPLTHDKRPVVHPIGLVPFPSLPGGYPHMSPAGAKQVTYAEGICQFILPADTTSSPFSPVALKSECLHTSAVQIPPKYGLAEAHFIWLMGFTSLPIFFRNVRVETRGWGGDDDDTTQVN